MAVLTPLLIGVLLLVVLCGRLVSAQLDLDTAAHAAARAASLARTPAAAITQARTAATDTLDARGLTCRHPDIAVNTGGLVPGGTVTVTIACTVPLNDLVLLDVPGSRQVQTTAQSPIDQWRGNQP